MIEVRTQKQLDAAPAKTNNGRDEEVWLRGDGEFEVSGSATVHAWGSATVHAWGSATVVRPNPGHRGAIQGGIVVPIVGPTTAAEWCDHYAVEVADGMATLYKVVRDDYRSVHGCLYAVGTEPEAPDWDAGVAECGGGLHFSPWPAMALEFDGEATRFLACRVALADMRAPQRSDNYPQKTKARRCVVVGEVDLNGKPVAR